MTIDICDACEDYNEDIPVYQVDFEVTKHDGLYHVCETCANSGTGLKLYELRTGLQIVHYAEAEEKLKSLGVVR